MDINQATKDLVNEAKSKARTAALEKVGSELFEWLAELRFPSHPKAENWSEGVIYHPPTPDDLEALGGARVRYAIQLFTQENQYLISILEALAPDDAGVFILTVHVNWQADEIRKRRTIESTYGADFDEMLRARHTLWVQSFTEGEAAAALNAGAVAILGHELKPHPPEQKPGEPIRPAVHQIVNFPESED